MSHLTSALRTAVALVGAGALVATLAACTGSSSGATNSPSTTAANGSDTAVAKTTRTVNVTVTAAKGCPAEQTTYPAGPLTFKIKNTDANAVSEVELLDGDRIIGEKENLPPSFSGEFAVNVTAGKYQLYCPGGTPEKSTVSVTGKSQGVTDSTVSALLKTAGQNYAKYVDTQVAALVVATTKFDKTLHGTNLKAAQAAYMQARPFYEKIEPVAESFPSLDTAIDVRIGDTTFGKWTGFHRIEYSLFKQKTLKGTAAFGDQLLAAVKTLKAKTATLTTYQPTELANGAQGLLDEVASSKITGEEEAYSLIDLLDFANNDEGAEQAFAQLQPAMMKIDPVLTRTLVARFAALDKLVATYQTSSNPSGYVLYNDLTQADKQKLAAAVKAVSTPLSTVGSKVANA
jgi:iron uptake system component EfeO